ncbi:MAG: AAA family ATPase [Myxococcales bacterium]|nr:AAA family ATPase [Myxococcales bacterium]
MSPSGEGLKISGIRILGFGHFHGYELSLSPGLNLLFGENEAGKSTLLAFIRAVLFGFERRQSPQRYQPESGDFGGELELSTHFGPLRVRRQGSRRRADGELHLRGPDGEPLPESRLAEALAGVTRELFFEVFAFGLGELSSFERLAEQGTVSEALFAAGMQGAQRLPQVVEVLRKSAEEIYTPRGVKPALNAALSALAEVQEKLRAVGDRPAHYLEARAQLGALEERLKDLDGRLSSAKAEHDRLRRLEAAVVDLCAAERLEKELSELPDLSGFPEAGVSRLEELLRQLAAARMEREELSAQVGALERELSWHQKAQGGERPEGELRAGLEAFTSRQPLRRSLESRRAALEETRRQLSAQLWGLGLGGDDSWLLGLDLGAAARGSLTEARERADRCERELSKAADALKAASGIRERAEEEVRRLTAQVTALPSVAASELRRVQAALARVEPLRVERARLADQMFDRRTSLDRLRAQLLASPRELFPLWSFFLGFLVLAAAVGALWLVEPRAFSAALAAAAALGAISLLVQRRAASSHREQCRALEAAAARRKQEVSHLESELEQLGAREGALGAELASVSSQAGVEPGAEPPRLARRADEVSEALAAVSRRAALAQELESLTAQLSAAVRQERAAQADRAMAEASLSRVLREIDALVVPKGFPKGLSARAAVELWSDAASIQQRLLELSAEGKALEADEKGCREAAERLVELARQAALSGVEELGPEGAATAVGALLERGQEAKEAVLKLGQKREVMLAQIAGRQRAVQELETGVASLLASAGCSEAEAFRARAAQAARFQKLRFALRESASRAEAATGLSAAEARAGLREAGGEAALLIRLEGMAQDLSVHEAEKKRLAEERGSFLERVKAWEEDAQVPAQRLKEEQLSARAMELANRVAIERLALSLLFRARRRFEREQQPKVIRLAAGLFGELTGGRYANVYTRGRELFVADAQGKEWNAEQLSRGTREQLYLAFRLAVIEDFGDTRVPLPIIVDDILVNFDPERTRHTLSVLARLSRRHQVIAFTCHPTLEELFRAAGAKVAPISARRQLSLVSSS